MMIHLLRLMFFAGVLVFAASSTLAETAAERQLVRELAQALAASTGEAGSVQLATSLPDAGQPGKRRFEEIDFDLRSRRFSLVVVQGEARDVVTGRYLSTQRIPVPRSRIAAGREIDDNDVQWIEVESARLGGDVVDAPDDLRGMAAKRDLAAGQPIRARDLTRPVMVAKGALVTMSFRSPHMTLTSTGRAVEQGGKGDVISVMNLHSKRTVFVVVTGPNQAEVTPGGVPAAVN